MNLSSTKKQGNYRAKHIPVLLNEVLDILKTQIKEIASSSDIVDISIIDLTLGDGGHSYAMYNMLKNMELALKINLFSIDWDKTSINFVSKAFKEYIDRIYWCDLGCESIEKKELTTFNSNISWSLVHANFAWISKFVTKLGIQNIYFILGDLGISSRQYEIDKRGFSFKNTNRAPVDMRMSPAFMKIKAYDLLNGLSEKELRDLFVANLGMSKHVAHQVAKEIVYERSLKPFGFQDDSYRLNNIAKKLRDKGIRKFHSNHLHPATLIYLALRMAVNSERQNLFQLWKSLKQVVTSYTKIAMIGFNSIEWELLETLPKLYGFELLNVIVPTNDEILSNSRARSAKLFIYKNV